jgi:hypothetical protein
MPPQERSLLWYDRKAFEERKCIAATFLQGPAFYRADLWVAKSTLRSAVLWCRDDTPALCGVPWLYPNYIPNLNLHKLRIWRGNEAINLPCS